MKRQFVHYYAATYASLPQVPGVGSESLKDFREQTASEQTRRNSSRPVLNEAMGYCRLHGSALHIACPMAWLDEPRFWEQLYGAGVPVAILDSPLLSDEVLASLRWAAEKKREHFRARTGKGALTAKRSGAKPANPRNPSNRIKGSRLGVERRQRNANERAIRIGPMLEAMRAQGLTYGAIAGELRRQKIATERGGTWTATQVMRVLARKRSLDCDASRVGPTPT